MASLAALVLICAYGIGAPFLLLRTALSIARRRRLRYRPVDDEVLATSRFTIPVSLVLPIHGEIPNPAAVVRRLMAFRYPELELIVVVSGAPATLATLRSDLDLRPGELFYRRSLPTGPVGTIYRSQSAPHLIVVEQPATSEGDSLNCGINLARYRYACVVDAGSAYDADALVETMQAALEDPSLVVGVTTSMTVTPIETVAATLDGQAPTGLMAAARYLAAARTRLLTVGRRRLDLPPGGCPGFTIWRRDSIIEAGGFASDTPNVHADMTFRLHRHYGGDRQRYRIIHVTEPVGTVEPLDARARMVTAGHVPFGVLWRHRGLAFNPRLGRLGSAGLPAVCLQPADRSLDRARSARPGGSGRPARRDYRRPAAARHLHRRARQRNDRDERTAAVRGSRARCAPDGALQPDPGRPCRVLPHSTRAPLEPDVRAVRRK